MLVRLVRLFADFPVDVQRERRDRDGDSDLNGVPNRQIAVNLNDLVGGRHAERHGAAHRLDAKQRHREGQRPWKRRAIAFRARTTALTARLAAPRASVAAPLATNQSHFLIERLKDE